NRDRSFIVLRHGELLLSQDVTIKAVGQVPVTVSGDGASRVFEVAPAAHVSLVNRVLTGGNGQAGAGGSPDFDGTGGSILNLGTLTVSASTLSGNTAGGTVETHCPARPVCINSPHETGKPSSPSAHPLQVPFAACPASRLADRGIGM